MDRNVSWYLLLLLVWCLFSACGLLMVVTAEPSVCALIITPEADRKEGGQIHMRCVATNLESEHVVEWMTEDPVKTLRWGNQTITANRRFMFETTHTGNGETTQDFNIIGLQRNDIGEYVCNVRDPISGGGHDIVATARVALSINVTDVAGSVTTCPQELETTAQTSTTLATVPSNTPVTVSSNTAVIAGASAGGAVALFLVLILIVVCRRRGLFSNTPSPSKSNVKPKSNQTGSQFSSDHSDLSQPHIYDSEALEAPNSHIYAYESHQLDQVMTANTEPEPTTSHPGTAPVTSTAERNNNPHYTKPHTGNVTHRSENEANLQHMNQSLDATTKQRYSNPVFDSDDSQDTRKPHEDRSAASLKPVAMVPPISKVPAKPKPYKPKAQRASTPQDNNANQEDGPMSPRPQSTPSALLTSLHSATPRVPNVYSHSSGTKTSPTLAHEDAPYALVSAPENRRDSDNHIVYAELDLQSIPSQDGDQPLSSVEPVVYASVMN